MKKHLTGIPGLVAAWLALALGLSGFFLVDAESRTLAAMACAAMSSGILWATAICGVVYFSVGTVSLLMVFSGGKPGMAMDPTLTTNDYFCEFSDEYLTNDARSARERVFKYGVGFLAILFLGAFSGSLVGYLSLGMA
ncbi:hypothetical protein [Variovorax paradoxus]|uniref:hypothetical protein n=1 Tax=Variovorax paradoxus TaxID=34073 RepID=UPI002787F134|nr:hypothetical protein [Variovorax paradoxus]MDP9932868.1 hypothetical protein [Variovorax paradoxus]